MKAMIEWCNEQGGINGRQIEGRYYDAKFTEANNVMQEACGQVFMLVGEGWASDGAAEETRLGCNLPAVPGYSVSRGVRQRTADVPGGAQPDRRQPRGLGRPAGQRRSPTRSRRRR